MKNILMLEKEKCIACGNCEYRCPQTAIVMNHGMDGFSYPVADDGECLHCGSCMNVCPLMRADSKEKRWTAYAYGADLTERWTAVGGGAAQALVEEYFGEDMAVWAPMFDGDYRDVEYRRVADKQDFIAHYTLNYVMPKLGDVFCRIKDDISLGKKTLFLGAPCHCAALRSCCEEKKGNLLTVGLACKGLLSPKVWKAYLEEKGKGYGIRRLRLHGKELGNRASLRMELCNEQQEIVEELQGEEFFAPYKDSLTKLSVCGSCSFEDYAWALDAYIDEQNPIGGVAPGVDDGKGVSLVIVKEGQELADLKRKEKDIWKELTVDTGKLKLGSKPGGEVSCSRKEFYAILDGYGYQAACGLAAGKKMLPGWSPQPLLDYHSGDKRAWKILNRSVWSLQNYQGCDTFFVHGISWQRIFLPLDFAPAAGKRYWFDIKFRAKTDSMQTRMMLTDDNTDKSTVAVSIWTAKISHTDWLRIETYFTVAREGLRYFMLTSTDFQGTDSFVCIDWIRITEA